MNENRNQPEVGDTPQGDPDQEPRTMTLMGGVVQNEDEQFADEPPPGSQSKLLNNSTMIVVLIAAVAAGSVYLMHLSLASSFREDDSTRQVAAKVETWLGKLSNPKKLDKNDPLRPENIRNLFADTSSIVKMFGGDFSGEQVPLKFVKKNPFQLGVGDSGNAAKASVKALRLRELKFALSQLSLQSVMNGSQPVTVINGNLKEVGDKVGPFVIKSIGSLSVKLTADGMSFDLQMNDSRSAKR